MADRSKSKRPRTRRPSAASSARARPMNQFLEAAGIALRAIWEYKLRSFLTVLGNIVAVTSIIAVVSLVQGMNEYAHKVIVADVAADNFTIQRYPLIRTQQEEDRFRNTPPVTMDEAAAVRKFSD